MNYLLLNNYGAIVDIGAIAFVAIFALIGYIKGFTKTFFAVFGTIIAILLAILLAPTLAELLQNSFSLVNTVSDSISDILVNIFGEQLMSMKLSEASAETLGQAGLAGFIVNIVLQIKGEGSLPLDTSLSQIICPTFAYYAVLIISAVALYIVFKIVFIIIRKIVKLAYACAVVKYIDKTLGLVIGLINGIFNLELVILALSIIPVAFCQDIYAGVQVSVFAKFIEDINLYGLLLNAISSQNVIGAVKNIINL